MRNPEDRADVCRQVTSPEAGATLLAAVLWGPAMTPPAWHDHAACRDTDLEDWFERSHHTDVARSRRELCASCPVTAECAADANEWETRHDPIRRYGYRAGQTPRARAQQPHQTTATDDQTIRIA